MNRDEKQFFTGLFIELKQDIKTLTHRFDGLEDRFDGLEDRFDKFEIRFDGLESKVDKNTEAIEGVKNRFDGLENKVDKNTEAIRHNGVLIEENSRKIDILAEGQSFLNERVSRLESDVSEIKENTSVLPVLMNVVKGHSKKLATL